MKLLNTGGLAALALVVWGCGNVIPNSGAPGDLGNPENFKYDTAEFFAASVGDRVLFAVDQTTLNPEARSILDAQASWMMENTGFTALIEGHADEQGTREYNLALGARRASAVQNYLVSRGLPDARLRTVTFGKERPIEICSIESCWSKNRRAVTVLSAIGSS